MAHKKMIMALGMIAAASPLFATSPEPVVYPAPAGTAETRYCLRVEPVIGSHIETIQCWTRDEWAAKEVNVDEEWAREGVAIIEGGVRQPKG